MRKKAIRVCFVNFRNDISDSARKSSDFRHESRISLSKRSQFKIQQMSFMLLAVILFFILVALFYLTIQYRSLHQQATQLEEDRASGIAQFLADSSEFSCPDKNYCVDTDKLIVLKNRSTYKEFWPVSSITIRKFDEKENKECTKANYPDCNIFSVYKNDKVTSSRTLGNFVALCRYELIENYLNRVCELGRISIGYEIK